MPSCWACAATSADSLEGSVESMLGKNVDFETLIDRVFWRMAILILMFFAAALVAGVHYRIAMQRSASELPRC